MPKIYLGEAIKLVGKTMPLVWVRLGSYLVLGLALGLYAGVFFGIGWLFAKLWAPLGFVVFLVAVGGAFWVVDLAGKYWFHLLRAAHTAVMTEFITTGHGPSTGQLEYGRKQVMSRFTDTSILFGVALLVGGIVKFIIRTFTRITSILPLPGVDSLGKFIERVAVMSTTYIDEAILSRAYAKREQNVWAVAHEGVVLYAQAWKPILANAVVLALISYVEFLVFLIILALPALAIGAAIPGLKVALGIGVVIGAWMLKLALSDAISLAATLLAYHRSTDGMEADPAWVAKLEGASDKFRELGRKAAASVTRRAERSAGEPATDVLAPSAGQATGAATGAGPTDYEPPATAPDIAASDVAAAGMAAPDAVTPDLGAPTASASVDGPTAAAPYPHPGSEPSDATS